MKMVPPVVAATTNSAAERKIFPILERTALDKNAVALHSIDLPRHVYKRMGEIDFVVLSRSGLLVCEVKGGRVSREDDGMWTYTNRYDESTTNAEGPFKQAASAMWSLRDDLASRVEKAILDQVSFGSCVMLPDCQFRQDSVDAPRELVIDATELSGARELAGPLTRLLTRWQRRNRLPDMSPEALDRVRHAIRRGFDLVPSLAVRARGIAADLETLTEEQYAGLDWVDRCPRLLVAGGAGTGKTLLAMETARRDALRGRDVLLTCQSPVLAKFLTDRAAAGVQVACIEDARQLVDQRGSPFDVVVIDEGQDVFSLEGITTVDALVDGGLDAGEWRCFYDLNNQSGLFGDFDREAHDLLAATGAHPVVLRRNCRNTKSIVLQTQAVTGADLGVPMAGAGPAVSYCKPTDRAEEMEMLVAELERLAHADVHAGAITILTGTGSGPSPISALDSALRARLTTLDQRTVAGWPLDRLTVARIEDFKGLENDFILVCGLTALDETQLDRARIYVAMSRARVGLWVAVPAELAGRFEERRRENVERMLAVQAGPS